MRTNTQLLNSVNRFKKKTLDNLKHSDIRPSDLSQFISNIDLADEALTRIVLIAREEKESE